MKHIFILFLFIVSFLSLSAQQGGFSGRAYDSLNFKSVVYATVSIIRKSDSVLIKHMRTNQQGMFSIGGLDTGKYILLIGHNSYADFVDDIQLKPGDGIKPLGIYTMFQRSQMVKEVIIKNSASIKIKGDTLEYTADSFKVKQGAMVEDLLKVMPGIQVNKKGEITAMGEKIEKVLVDGEEFFGDDPTVATQNIQSKVVDKVQVFDKKSDQAQFTGFDDGQEKKTINLKLKKNMNKGQFGKIELGSDFKDRWQNQAMVNSFHDKEQVSVYGLMSSNGKTGLGWEDNQAYTGSGEGMQMNEDGGFMWNFSDDFEDVDFGRGVPEGFTKAWVGGAHYANKWDENKQHTNLNYSFGRINRSKSEHSHSENLLPNGRYLTDDTATSYSSRNTHKITAKYDFAIDSTFTIIYNLNARLAFNEGIDENKTRNQTASDALINSSNRKTTSNSTTLRINNALTFNKKLKKVGRTISLNATYNYNNNSATGLQTGVNQYVKPNGTQIELLDLEKLQQLRANTYGTELTYTEPLSKKLILKTSYAFSYDQNNSTKETLEKPTANDDYTQQVDSLSNIGAYKTIGHTVGTELRFNEKKYNVTAGVKVRYSQFHQDDLVRLKNYDYNRTNFLPTLRFNYKFDQFKRFTFSYNGTTRQPSINQLQTLNDNTNPLEITIGNPNLKIAYTQNFSANYFNYKVLSGRSIYSGLNFSNTFNSISLNRTYDGLGRTVNQYVNLNGGYNASLWGGLSSKIRKSNFEGKLNVNGNLNHSPNIINNVTGITNTISLTLTPGLTYSKGETFYTSLDLGTIYSKSKSSLNSARSIEYISFNPSWSVTYTTPFHMDISTDMDYQHTPPVAPYNSSFDRFIWNGYISYKFLRSKTLEVRASVNDILNQNKGYERTTTDNYNKERFFQTLGRYGMLSAIWNFNTGPMAASQQGGPKMKGPRGGGGMRRRMH